MFSNKLVVEALRIVKEILTLGAGVQNRERRRLIKELTDICSRCEDAYAAVIKRLRPIKAVSTKRKKLASALHDFYADDETRAAFKPEHLCSDIDTLLADTNQYLSGLGYSVSYFSLGEVRHSLNEIGNFDQALKDQYERFTYHLDQVATALDAADRAQSKALQEAVRVEITLFEQDMRRSLRGLRRVKRDVVDIM